MKIEDKNAFLGFFYFKGGFNQKMYNTCVNTFLFFSKSCKQLIANVDFSVRPLRGILFYNLMFFWFLIGLLVLAIEIVIFSLLFLFIQFFYIIFGFIFGVIESIYLYWNKITVLCPKCNKKVDQPIYYCPQCNAEHTDLYPTLKYGILHRKCTCGKKLPTFMFWGKKKLKAKCPYCSGSIEPLEYTPHTIAFIGGKSVGKTFLRNVMCVFLNSYVNERGKRNRRKGTTFFEKIICAFHNWRANRHCWRTKIHPDDKTKVLTIENEIRIGKRPNETQLGVTASAIRINLKRGYHSIVERLYLYDAPGEAFTKEDYMKSYVYYESLQTLIFVIDPLSFPNILQQLDNVRSIQHISTESPVSCFEKWLNSMERVHTDGNLDHLQNVRCAVVITKIDMPELKNLCNLTVDSTSDECKAFIDANGLSRIISLVDNHFNHVKYFAVSCTGGKPDGTPFTPEGLGNLWEWILNK